MSDILERIRHRIPLHIRLRVMFEMEWLAQNIIPDREATDEELEKAYLWGKKMTQWVIETIQEWEKDGSPE